jgi:hypothetical protein
MTRWLGGDVMTRLSTYSLLLALAGVGCAQETLENHRGESQASASVPAAPEKPVRMPEPWPPRVGERYPDLDLLDTEGRPLKLSSFAGRVILLEPIGMNCPACNAFAGANLAGRGGLNGLRPQQGLPSIYEGLERWATGVDPGDARLVLLHLLLYDYDMQAPDVADARHWEEHFEVSRHGGTVVVPAHDLRNRATYQLIPGFQLVDQRFVLRFDSSGHQPRHSLWNDLLPALPAVLEGR